MSAATPTMPPDAAQPGLSQGARIINTFIAPSKTFADIRRNSSWWVVWLLGAVIGVGFGAIAVQKIDLIRFNREQIEKSKFGAKQFEQLPPEQQEQRLRISATFSKILFFAGPFVFSLIGALIVGAFLMAVFNFGFAAEVSFSRALALTFYSYLPRSTIYVILLGISLLMASDPNTIDFSGNAMPTNPGFFMNPEGSKFLLGLLSGIDIVALWVSYLLGLGFSVASERKLKASTAIITVMVIYGIVVLAGAGLKAAFS